MEFAIRLMPWAVAAQGPEDYLPKGNGLIFPTLLRTKEIMRTKILIIIILAGAMLAAIPVLLNVNSAHSSPKPSESFSETSAQDGPALLQSYCGKCHVKGEFERTKWTRGELETALKKMEKYGVEIGGEDQTVLLDYLTDPDSK